MRYFLWVAVFFALAQGTFYRMKGRHLEPVGYIRYFQKHKGYYYRQFHKKIRSPLPDWAAKQISQDLPKRPITLSALNATQKAILQNKAFETNRYRIVNQRLYRYFDPELDAVQKSWDPMQQETVTWFEDALKTLLALVHLPNLDFIVTHADGTFEPFYVTQDPVMQAPILGWAKLQSLPFFALIPDWRSLSIMWHDDIRKFKDGKCFQGDKVPWENKKDMVFWRGALSEPIHRLRLAQLSLEHPSLINAGIMSFASSNPLYKPAERHEEHLHYKYQPVMDGVMCSYPGYQWRLLTDATPFKQASEQIQWFYGALKPYEHYVPIQQDLSDLVEKILWARAHDEECRKIAERSQEFALQHLMFDDIYCYFYHVLVAYSKLQDDTLDWQNLSGWKEI